MQPKKKTSANFSFVSGSPLPINTKVISDSDTTAFRNKYLHLADKALHTTEQRDCHQDRPDRSARLRLEPQDGTPAKDYRIQEGEIEVRTLATGGPLLSSQWQRLTAADIAYHVQNNTVVARWLESRLGWRTVLRKCVQTEGQRKAA